MPSLSRPNSYQNPSYLKYEAKTQAKLCWYTYNTVSQSYEKKTRMIEWIDLDRLAWGESSTHALIPLDLQNLFKAHAGDERYAFMCADDAMNMASFAIEQKVFISVRNTGPQTVARLSESGAGYACKPHAILDKTIKPKTLKQAVEDIGGIVGKLKGRFSVRFKLSPSGASWWSKQFAQITTISTDTTNGDGLLAESSNLDLKSALETFCTNLSSNIYPAQGFVGWWVTLEFKLANNGSSYSLKMPIGILTVGTLLGKKAQNEKGVGVHFSELGTTTAPTIPFDAYTGDYDLHCIFEASSESVTGQPADPHNHAKGRVGTLLALLNRSESPFYRKRRIPSRSFVDTDTYRNLFQHGQQGSYDTYLLDQNYGLPYFKRMLAEEQAASAAGRASSSASRESVVSSLLVPDSGVLAFGPNGDVHIMSSLPEMLAFYRLNGLDTNPFTSGTPCQLEVIAKLDYHVNDVLQSQTDQKIAFYTTGMLASPSSPMIILKSDFTISTGVVTSITPGWENLFKQAFIYAPSVSSMSTSIPQEQAIASTYLYPPTLSIFCDALSHQNIFLRAVLDATGATRSVYLRVPMHGTLAAYQQLYNVTGYTLSAISNGIQCTSTVTGHTETQQLIWE